MALAETKSVFSPKSTFVDHGVAKVVVEIDHGGEGHVNAQLFALRSNLSPFGRSVHRCWWHQGWVDAKLHNALQKTHAQTHSPSMPINRVCGCYPERGWWVRVVFWDCPEKQNTTNFVLSDHFKMRRSSISSFLEKALTINNCPNFDQGPLWIAGCRQNCFTIL